GQSPRIGSNRVSEPGRVYEQPDMWSRGSHVLKSRVVCAVLGLVIEKPSYGYEISQRFDRRFGGFLQTSGRSRIYAALATLEKAQLVERMAGMPSTEVSRGAKAGDQYRATASGARAYRGRLAQRIRDDPQRVELLGRMTLAAIQGIDAALELIDQFEQECLREARDLALPSQDDLSEADDIPKLMERLILEERRRTIDAHHGWIAYARAQLRSFTQADVGRGDLP